MEIPKSWGVSWNADIVHCPDCRTCHACGWKGSRYLAFIPYGIQFMVGYDANAPCNRDDDQAGAFIFECPKCFEKFWFHANIAALDLITSLAAWPK